MAGETSTTEGQRGSGTRKKLFTVAGILGLIGALSALIKNVDALSKPMAGVGLFLNERGTAALLRSDGYRNKAAAALLAKQHPDGIACYLRSVPIDLDGDGVRSDMAVIFQRTEKPGDCKIVEGPEDAAFFVSAWNGYRYVGDPELPSAVTAWNFAGPAAFREAADSSYPTIHIYMLEDGKIAEVGGIDTVTSAEYTGSTYIASKDGRSAMVLTQASITRVGLDPAGKPFVTEIDGKRLAAENQEIHLLAYTAEGKLSFDGDPNRVDADFSVPQSDPKAPAPDTANPQSGDHFVIPIAPGYRLYLVGCKPSNGLTPIDGDPGAYRVDLTQRPAVGCPTGEESSFSVRIAAKSF